MFYEGILISICPRVYIKGTEHAEADRNSIYTHDCGRLPYVPCMLSVVDLKMNGTHMAHDSYSRPCKAITGGNMHRHMTSDY